MANVNAPRPPQQTAPDPNAPDPNAPTGPEPDEDDDEDSKPAKRHESGSYRVLTSALTLARSGDKRDGADRHMRGARVKLDAAVHDIDRLVSLRAIEPYHAEKSLGPTTARHLVAAANLTAQENPPDELPDGKPQTPTDEQVDELS